MGKGGDRAVAKAGPTDNEVLINGTYYDVTNLKHPGGSVIKFYQGNGIDATQAYDNFHVRSKKAMNYMKSLPNRTADPKVVEATRLKGQTALLKDFDKLTAELKAEGFFDPAPLHVLYRIIEVVAIYAAGIWLLFNAETTTATKIGGIALMGLASGRCGWLMHEGGHYSLTGHIPTDRMLQIVLYGVGCGMSAGWWRSQHNKHHSMPQKIGHDVDLATLPLVAFTTKVAKKIGNPLKKWISMQAFLFPVITTSLVATGWQLYLHPRYIMRTKNVAEAISLLVRFALWHVFITGEFGVAKSAAIYVFYNWCASNYIFINFAVSHTHLPTVPKEDTQVDWVRYAAIHTMNVTPGYFNFVDWWMSYLNYQIEHHLYPSMPQFRHPIVSERVRTLFKKHNVIYDERDYITSMAVTFKNLHTVGMDVFYG
jgi:fatty acid desaturase